MGKSERMRDRLKLKDRLFWALFPQMQILSSVIANKQEIFDIVIP